MIPEGYSSILRYIDPDYLDNSAICGKFNSANPPSLCESTLKCGGSFFIWRQYALQ